MPSYSRVVVLYADDRVWILLQRVLILIVVCILLASLEQYAYCIASMHNIMHTIILCCMHSLDTTLVASTVSQLTETKMRMIRGHSKVMKSSEDESLYLSCTHTLYLLLGVCIMHTTSLVLQYSLVVCISYSMHSMHMAYQLVVLEQGIIIMHTTRTSRVIIINIRLVYITSSSI